MKIVATCLLGLAFIANAAPEPGDLEDDFALELLLKICPRGKEELAPEPLYLQIVQPAKKASVRLVKMLLANHAAGEEKNLTTIHSLQILATPLLYYLHFLEQQGRDIQALEINIEQMVLGKLLPRETYQEFISQMGTLDLNTTPDEEQSAFVAWLKK